MVAQIINRGRGPEIAGTRITVYDVLDYRKHGWHRDVIAGFFRLSSEQIQAAFDYIDAHHDEVMAEYQRILDRHKNYVYPPDVLAKIERAKGGAARRRDELKAMREGKGANGQDPVGS
jgi:uncharacterized protein (DUF433 family)